MAGAVGIHWPEATAVKMQHRVNAVIPAGLLDHLKVDAYGDKLSLRSMASVSVRESQLLAVSAFDAQVAPGCLSPSRTCQALLQSQECLALCGR